MVKYSTVSIATTTLSSVITGWGEKLTTCSRRSISGRTRSINGVTNVNPGSSVRWYRPSRSSTAARACGMIRIVLAAITSATTTSTATTINATTWVSSLWHDERRGAPDLNHFDLPARGDHLLLVIRARRPHLAADL